MAQFKFTWLASGQEKSKVIEAKDYLEAHSLWEFQIGKPSEVKVEQVSEKIISYVEKLKFLHKQSLANLRMIEIAEDQIERDRWISEYTDNQIELMNLQKVNHAL
jgi:hypothetical protein